MLFLEGPWAANNEIRNVWGVREGRWQTPSVQQNNTVLTICPRVVQGAARAEHVREAEGEMVVLGKVVLTEGGSLSTSGSQGIHMGYL